MIRLGPHPDVEPPGSSAGVSAMAPTPTPERTMMRVERPPWKARHFGTLAGGVAAVAPWPVMLAHLYLVEAAMWASGATAVVVVVWALTMMIIRSGTETATVEREHGSAVTDLNDKYRELRGSIAQLRKDHEGHYHPAKK